MSGVGAPPELLNAMVCAVLNRSSVRDDESFFEAGGNSLLAARLVASIGSRIGVAASVRDVYEHPTISELSAHLAGAEPSVPALQRQPRPDVVPLAPVQRRLWFQNRLHTEDASYNMATAVRIEGSLDVRALRRALEQLVERHEVLRTVFPDWDGVPQQVVLTSDEAGFELVERRCGAGRGVDAVSAEADIGFDITVDTPFRAVLFHEGPERHVLGLVVHHIACDGWSLAPMLGDLAAAYRSHLTGDGAQADPLEVQYADYALWAQQHAGSPDASERELDFWCRELAHAPPVPVLEGMRPRVGTPTNRGGELRHHLGAELHARLVERARELGASPFMVVHAALAVALQRMGGAEDCVIGTPVAGRADPALDPLIGFFVNTLALRVDLSGNPTFAGLVARVRATDLAALAHDRVPFDAVLQELNPPREGGWLPLFGVMLAFQNTARAELDLPGLRTETLVVPTRSARFDLRLEVVEQDVAGVSAGLDLTATWAEQVGSVAVAARLVALLEQVLEEGLADPRREARRLGRADGTPLDRPPMPAPADFPRELTGHPRIGFVCSPFGQQWAGMGRSMLEREPVFARAVEECRAELAPYADWDVLEELARPPETSRLEDVTIGQPLVFVVQVALARWLEHEGVVPTVVAGHSLGEIAACVIAGVLDLPDAARVVHHYTQQQGHLAGREGRMLLVEAAVTRVERVLESGFESVVVATVNGPRTTAVAGARLDLERLKAEFEAQNTMCAWIRVDLAAHSPDIDAVMPTLVQRIRGIRPREPRLTMVSSVTGRVLDRDVVGPEYFAENLRRRVQMASAVETVLSQPTGALVELSANPILGPALTECVDDLGCPTHVLSTICRADGDDRIGPLRVRDFLVGA